MAANTNPIFPLTPKVKGVEITAANTKSDGSGTIGTDIFLVDTVGADGAKLKAIWWWPTGTTAGTATTATVGRAFVSSQSSGATTSANTDPLGEIQLGVATADSASVPVSPIIQSFADVTLPANASILATCHAAPAASTKWKPVAHYGNY